MDTSTSAQAAKAAMGWSASKRNPAFVRKAPSGEWHTLIKATSSMQQQAGTGKGWTHEHLLSTPVAQRVALAKERPVLVKVTISMQHASTGKTPLLNRLSMKTMRRKQHALAG